MHHGRLFWKVPRELGFREGSWFQSSLVISQDTWMMQKFTCTIWPLWAVVHLPEGGGREIKFEGSLQIYILHDSKFIQMSAPTWMARFQASPIQKPF